MSDEAADRPPAPPEVLVRVQPISDLKAFKRHLFRMFDQGQPCYPDAYDADDEPWNLWTEMVADFVEDWQPIDTDRESPDRTRIALALSLSMPAGTDPAADEAAVLAVARKAFAGRDQVWVAGEHEGPFVKMLVEYRDGRSRAVPSGLADLSLPGGLCPRAGCPRRRGAGDQSWRLGAGVRRRARRLQGASAIG